MTRVALGLATTLFLIVGASLAHTDTLVGQSAAAHSSDRPQSGSLGPGDFIVLKIWREPDLSDTVQVDNDGDAVFSKLGRMSVTGIRPDSLERLLVSRYSQFLVNPSIRVTVLRRITIWGAVAKPGPYPVDLTMSITDALALAGGPTSDGKADKVELHRGNERLTLDLANQQLGVGETSLRSGDQLFVPRRSWVSRNAGLVVGLVGTVTSVAYLLAR